MEIADRYRIDPGAAETPDRLQKGFGVERDLDAPVGADPFADAEAKMPGHERRLAGEPHVVALGLQPLAHLEDVAMSFGSEETDPGSFPLDERVRRDGHAVDNRIGSGEQIAEGEPELPRQPCEAIHDPRGLVGGRASGLGERDPPPFGDRNYVREGPAHVHTDAQASS